MKSMAIRARIGNTLGELSFWSKAFNEGGGIVGTSQHVGYIQAQRSHVIPQKSKISLSPNQALNLENLLASFYPSLRPSLSSELVYSYPTPNSKPIHKLTEVKNCRGIKCTQHTLTPTSLPRSLIRHNPIICDAPPPFPPPTLAWRSPFAL